MTYADVAAGKRPARLVRWARGSHAHARGRIRRAAPRREPDRLIGERGHRSALGGAGDWNAFFGLALDNLTQLVILSSLLIGVFAFPADLVLRVMIPGTAAGVLVGDLAYTWLAVRLMRTTGRTDVTALPFGIDTPSLFGMVFGVLGPAMLLTRDPILAWKIGMGVTVGMGAAKLVLAFAGDWVRRSSRAPRSSGRSRASPSCSSRSCHR